MVWQFFVLVIASIGFPVLTLLFMMGGLEYHDRPAQAQGAARQG
ncbi:MULTISPECIES: hypothetical protein [Kitasatospora]|nr:MULTISPECIES: hypothetical protein [Kitasatospora]